MRLFLLAALTLAACQKRDQPPPPRARDGGFAVTGRGAGARPLHGFQIDAALGALAIPDCLAIVQIYQDCVPKLPEAARDSFVQARKMMIESYGQVELTPESEPVMRDACRQMREAIRDGMEQLCGPWPSP